MTEFRLLIGGKLVTGDAEMEVINPATEEIVATCARASLTQFNNAVAAAKAAFPGWSHTPIEGRKAILNRIAEVVESNAEELALLLTQEQGKPLADARAEVGGLAYLFRSITSLDLPIVVLEESEQRRVESHHAPLGVIGAIVPWNYPLILLAYKLPPALLMGNTVVLKPAPSTPLSTLKFGELIANIVPAGVVNIIADAGDLGAAMTAHPDIRKISFTGSTKTGVQVMASAATLLKRVTLELGGNDAGIVLDDVDPKKAAPKLFQSAFQSSGQVCIALKRLYVHESIYDAMCDEMAALADAAIVGDGLQSGTQYGPVQNRAQFARVKALIEDARETGNVIAGGVVSARAGFFIRPTIVRDINDHTRLVDEEQFGPVLPILRFADAADAVRRANASPFGLGGSIWSTNVNRAYELAKDMDAGTVWINKHADLTPNIPFGGAKQSGLGTELGLEGLAEFTQLKIINVALQ